MEKLEKVICVYLAVDKDGTEKLFSNNWGVVRMSKYDSSWNGPDIYMPRVKEKTYWGKESLGGSEDYDAYTILPSGTIKKLIGKNLTWDDNIIEYRG